MTTTRPWTAPHPQPHIALDEAGSHPDADVDVVVVGAGPVGLTLACALLHHGVSVRIFERAPGPSGASKGHNLLPRSQELLETIGVRAAIATRAHPAPQTRIFLDREPLAQLDTRGCGSPFEAVVFSSQGAIEEVLADAVVQRGGRVERGREVQEVHPDDDGVTVTVGTTQPAGDQDGQRDGAQDGERVRCRYLVGADGVHGSVRTAVDLDVDLTRLEGRATRQIDAKIAWNRSTALDTGWFFLYEHGFAGVLPVWEGLHRLFFIEDDALVPEREPTLEEMTQRARQVTGDETLALSDPVWTSHGHFSHGVAPAYSRGRVFLVGDAGHHTLPIGGQGMNAGLHDAVGLAWRLAMTLAGQGGPVVLDSYSPERHGEHARLDQQQVKGFQRLVHRPRGVDAAVAAVAALIPDLASKVFGGEDLTQLSVAYPDSPLSTDRSSAFDRARRGAPRAGARAPDARVTTWSGTTTSLFEEVHHPDGLSWGWCLLAFDGRRRSSHPALARAVRAASSWPWVRPRLVLADPTTPEDGADGAGDAARPPVLLDLDGLAHAAYGLQGRPALVLLRPDGHIAFRGTADHPEQLEAYCREVSGRTSVPLPEHPVPSRTGAVGTAVGPRG